MSEARTSQTPVYRSPRPESEETGPLVSPQAEYDPAAPGLYETPCSPWHASLGNQTPLQPHSEPSKEERDADQATPDHPCNYCHRMHWYAGTNATPCPAGTKLPSPQRHKRGHNTRGRRQHLPQTACSNCGQHHWCSGKNATPCETRYLFEPRKRLHRVSPAQSSEARHLCRRCSVPHYRAGPDKSPCSRSKFAGTGSPMLGSRDKVRFSGEVPHNPHFKIEDEPRAVLQVPWHQ